jgi:hypothetical protein
MVEYPYVSVLRVFTVPLAYGDVCGCRPPSRRGGGGNPRAPDRGQRRSSCDPTHGQDPAEGHHASPWPSGLRPAQTRLGNCRTREWGCASPKSGGAPLASDFAPGYYHNAPVCLTGTAHASAPVARACACVSGTFKGALAVEVHCQCYGGTPTRTVCAAVTRSQHDPGPASEAASHRASLGLRLSGGLSATASAGSSRPGPPSTVTVAGDGAASGPGQCRSGPEPR